MHSSAVARSACIVAPLPVGGCCCSVASILVTLVAPAVGVGVLLLQGMLVDKSCTSLLGIHMHAWTPVTRAQAAHALARAARTRMHTHTTYTPHAHAHVHAHAHTRTHAHTHTRAHTKGPPLASSTNALLPSPVLPSPERHPHTYIGLERRRLSDLAVRGFLSPYGGVGREDRAVPAARQVCARAVALRAHQQGHGGAGLVRLWRAPGNAQHS